MARKLITLFIILLLAQVRIAMGNELQVFDDICNIDPFSRLIAVLVSDIPEYDPNEYQAQLDDKNKYLLDVKFHSREKRRHEIEIKKIERDIDDINYNSKTYCQRNGISAEECNETGLSDQKEELERSKKYYDRRIRQIRDHRKTSIKEAYKYGASNKEIDDYTRMGELSADEIENMYLEVE